MSQHAPCLPQRRARHRLAALAAGLALAACPVLADPPVAAAPAPAASRHQPRGVPATPIRHLVVIYDENHSFDNYFGTYPHAANPAGEHAIHSSTGTQ